LNWEAIGAGGEVLGAMGVIVTLGYLAAQIRQSSKATRSSTRQAVSTAQVELGLQVAGNPDLRAAFGRWNGGQPPANPDEELCGHILRRAILRALENQFHQHRDGTFDESVWAGYLESMRRSFAVPGAGQFWEENRALYSAEFASFVESQLLEQGNDERKP
jgi:hypothetical protein